MRVIFGWIAGIAFLLGIVLPILGYHRDVRYGTERGDAIQSLRMQQGTCFALAMGCCVIAATAKRQRVRRG